MGKKVKETDETNTRQELTINLFGPGMTALHKVGLAGLWMTLKALEKENGGKPGLDGVQGFMGTHRNVRHPTVGW